MTVKVTEASTGAPVADAYAVAGALVDGYYCEQGGHDERQRGRQAEAGSRVTEARLGRASRLSPDLLQPGRCGLCRHRALRLPSDKNAFLVTR